MAEVHHDRRADVALLTMNRPVANALAVSLRAELIREIEQAVEDPTVTAIVLAGAGHDFSNGVDVTDYDGELQRPWVSDVCLTIEKASKPIVAALHGAVLGGGFELALAAHARVAARDTRIGLPEVQLGLIPNGGATQRLPRLVGAQVAFTLMLSGQSLSVTDPKVARLIDEITDGSVVDAAIAHARALANDGNWIPTAERSTGLTDPISFQMSVADLREKLRNPKSPEADIVTCVEAAQLLPMDRGLALEMVRFNDRRMSQDARARRHFHVAERRAMIFPEKAHGIAGQIREVLIPGSGPLATELAIACLDTGLRVTLMAESVETTEAMRRQIETIYDNAHKAGAFSRETCDEVMSRVVPDWPDEGLARADLVLDTGQIDLHAHHGSLNPRAIWACVSNIEEMPTTAPEGIGGRRVDLRFYRPALSIKLAELGVPPGAYADTVVTVADMLNRSGRTVVRCDCVDGLVGGNMSAALFAASLALAKSGVGPYRIDAAARGLGFKRGPFRLMDEEGLPAVADRLRRRQQSGGPGDSDVLVPRIAIGATGRTAGRGFYIYDTDGTHYDPDLRDAVGKVLPTGLPDPRAALEAALANEAMRLLSAGVVQRASDIDVVMVHAFGFEPHRGGPLFQADISGQFNVLKTLKQLVPLSPALWTPQPGIEDMVKNGMGFFGRAGDR